MTTDPLTPSGPDLEDEHDDDIEDFKAWQRTGKAKRKPKKADIFGWIVTMPTSMPLALTLAEARLSKSHADEDVKEVIGHLFGADALEHWAANGADDEDFQVLMTYGYSHAHGNPITFQEAADIVAKGLEDEARREAERAAGKARKKAKRKGPGGGSPATGR